MPVRVPVFQIRSRAKTGTWETTLLLVVTHSLPPRQQARIIDAARYWLAANPTAVESPIRFDAILVAPGKIPRHLPGTFDATQRKWS